MPEANVANTVAILGRTNVVPVFTHWKTVVFNDPTNRAAVRVNSLFITNRSTNTVDVDLRIARDQQFAPGAVYYGNNSYSYLMNKWVLPKQTTVIAISRDNPIWLQPGDFLQIAGSLNYCLEAVCSYEFISDQSPEPTTTLTTAGPILNLNAAPVFKSGGGDFGGTSGGGVELTWSPPFSTGGVAISNYLVQFRAKVVYSTSPLIEGFSGWALLEKPVSSVPNLVLMPNALLAYPRSLSDIAFSYNPLPIDFTSFNGAVGLTPSNVVGFQFRVAAYTPMGLGAWSEPSEMIRMDAIGTIGDFTIGNAAKVGVVEAISIEALPNGATVNWAGKEARTNPRGGEMLTIKDYRVRWSDDNGVTWLPSAAGIRLNNIIVPPPSSVEIRGLQNGVDYTFSVQTICSRVYGNEEDEIVGPWSLPSRNITPPGYTNSTQAQAALKAVFMRWE
jgi:hypothetical protein